VKNPVAATTENREAWTFPVPGPQEVTPGDALAGPERRSGLDQPEPSYFGSSARIDSIYLTNSGSPTRLLSLSGG
jgi:hypothetical protein